MPPADPQKSVSLVPARYPSLILSVSAATAVVLLWFAVGGHVGFDFADEGFFWYGAQRVLAGEVPIRDFMSYDPGRYYWTAGVMSLIGSDGVYAARIASVIFEVIGISLGTYLVVATQNVGYATRLTYSIVVASLLTVWVLPYYKVFDHTMSIVLVAAVAAALRWNTPTVWFGTGLCVGLAAIIGRNHGVYGMLGSVLAMAVLYFGYRPKKSAAVSPLAWVLGVVTGYSPMLAAVIAVDGFATALSNSIRAIFELGATNIPRPVPWPWTVDLSRLGVLTGMTVVGIGLGFVMLVAFPLIGSAYLLRRRPDYSVGANAVFGASVIMAVPYAHYGFSRADVVHLSLAIFPILIGLLTMPIALQVKPRVLAALAIFVSSIFVLKNVQPSLVYAQDRGRWKAVNVGGDLIIHRNAAHFELLRNLVQSYAKNETDFLALPNLPSLHAIYRSKMPVRDIYALFPRSERFQNDEIYRIMNSEISLIIISNHALDGNEDLRYRNLQPITYLWITENFKRIELDSNLKQADDLEVYRRSPLSTGQ